MVHTESKGVDTMDRFQPPMEWEDRRRPEQEDEMEAFKRQRDLELEEEAEDD